MKIKIALTAIILLLTGCTCQFSLTPSDIIGLYNRTHSRSLENTYITENGSIVTIKE